MLKGKRVVIWQLILVLLLYFILFSVIFFSKEISVGISNGINLSINLLIPSMFFFMIFSNMMINSNGKALLVLPFGFLKKVLRISELELAILILSLIGGYPVGAKLLHSGIACGDISPKRASSLLCFCVNCGPAFLISGVGASILKSGTLGVILFFSQVVACITVAYLTGIIYRRGKNLSNILPKHSTSQISLPALVVSSVKDAIRSICTICGFVVAFSACMPILKLLFESTQFSVLIEGLLEVTAGCGALSSLPPNTAMILAAIFTSFGGVCVLLQVYAIQSGSGISFSPFLLWRVLYVAVSVGVTQLLTTCFPSTLECFSVISATKQPWSVSPLASAFLILLCIMLLFFSKKSDKIKV